MASGCPRSFPVLRNLTIIEIELIMMILSKLIVHNQQSSKCVSIFMRTLVGFCFLSLLWIQSAFSYALEDFTNGLNRDSIPSSLKKAMWKASGGPYIADGLVETEDNMFYFLSGSTSLAVFNKNNNEVSGGWPIATNETCSSTPGCKSTWWHSRWREEELLEPLLIQRLTDLYGNLAFNNSYVADGFRKTLDTMGCMHHTPLRYGDIDGDGINELVVLLAQGYSIDWLIFSPAKQKTIFVSKLNIDDSIITSQAPSELMPWHEDSKRYQYWMQTQVNNGSPLYRPGLKAYAKLYFNDFDGDGAFDILVWRKMYESRLVGDPVAGYELKGELLGHYELVEGEYRLQATNAETVKGWLTESQQSWSMGYPRESECSGQEGQLIPEVHDPILNDPEVLETVPTSEPTPTPRDE